MKGLSKHGYKFLIIGVGLFIILIICMSMRTIEGFILTTPLPLENNPNYLNSLLSSHSTPLSKTLPNTSFKRCTKIGQPCDSKHSCSFDGYCKPNNQFFSEDGEKCNTSPYYTICKNRGSSLCYNKICTPISTLSKIPGYKNEGGFIYIPQNPPATCNWGTSCPNEGVCLNSVCYDFYNNN